LSDHIPDVARHLAFDVLRRVTFGGAYANLALGQALGQAGLSPRDAAFATELVAGTCRGRGVYDRIIEQASGRSLTTLQPAVLDLLRLGAHQLLVLKTPPHAAVSTTVDLAAETVGRRVTGVVNAILRKVAARTLGEWTTLLSQGRPPVEALGLRTLHPTWVAQAYVDVLGADAAEAALEANNVPPTTTLAVRPGLVGVDEVLAEAGPGASPGRRSPFAVTIDGDPGRLAAVREGRAGVADEGSQLVALALAASVAPRGPWLDLCAGPGGKAALLAGLAAEEGAELVANEPNAQRADLVRHALAAYSDPPSVTEADGRTPPWPKGSFARVLVDAPCTGLGALRRRPDARWRKSPGDLDTLVPLQRALLASALDLARPGGVVVYATCSPHLAETAGVLDAVLARRPDVAESSRTQLWPHVDGTDAMFWATLRLPEP
jgi:16S rRNA (cytosine967-C5)-methyltransferase